jgi:hypothetical protein
MSGIRVTPPPHQGLGKSVHSNLLTESYRKGVQTHRRHNGDIPVEPLVFHWVPRKFIQPFVAL